MPQYATLKTRNDVGNTTIEIISIFVKSTHWLHPLVASIFDCTIDLSRPLSVPFFFNSYLPTHPAMDIFGLMSIFTSFDWWFREVDLLKERPRWNLIKSIKPYSDKAKKTFTMQYKIHIVTALTLSDFGDVELMLMLYE